MKLNWTLILSWTLFVFVVRLSTVESSRASAETIVQNSGDAPRHAANLLLGENVRKARFFSTFSFVSTIHQSCRYDEQRNGTCMQGAECRTVGGKYQSFSNCDLSQGSTFGVCCLLELTCGGIVTARNNSYFVNPSFPSVTNTPQTCDLLIPTEGACFIRLDFYNFSIHSPVNGSCVADQFFVPQLMHMVPMICGHNNNSHMYIFVADRIQISLRVNLGEWTGARQWLVKIARISCNSPWKPYGESCLQFFQDRSGSIKSFNFDDESPNSSHMIAGEDYTICVKQSRLQCYNKWSSQFFFLSPSRGGASVVGDECEDNFVTISRGHDLSENARTYDRFCGEVFSAVKNSSEPSDIYSDSFPFNIRVHTSKNYSSLRKGFKIHYRQLQCLQPAVAMYDK